jgi:hypothetical protein
MTPEEFFNGNPLSNQLYSAIQQEVNALGNAGMRVSKSQIAFYRQRTFAWVWMPGQYLKGSAAPLVLTLSLPARDASPRWKEIVTPAPGRYTHHLELNHTTDIDAQVTGWLRLAWENAG